MGKKLSINKVSHKISKEDKKKEQHQLNTMINILRPKVYITHSSDFKRLVQELTGNTRANKPTIIEIPEAPENWSPVLSVDVSSDADTSNSNNNNNSNENFVDILSSSYDSPSGGEIVVPDNLYSMLDEAEGYVHHNNMEKQFTTPISPSQNSDDLVSLSPPSSSSCDWPLEMMDPFICYDNFYQFEDVCFNSFDVPKEQALYYHQEASVFENIELLQW